MAVTDGPFQRPAGGQQLGPAAGGSHLADQGIHCSTLDPRHIAGILKIGRFGSEQVCVLLSGIVRAAVGKRGDVKLKFLQPLLVQRKVNRPELQLHTQLLKVSRPGRNHPGAPLIAVEVLNHHGFAACVAQRAVTHLPTRGLQQGLRLAQVVP